MPVFSYKAISSSGVPVEGKQAAISVDVLRSELAANNLLLQSAKPLGNWRNRWFKFGAVSREQFLLFSQELISLLNSGMSLPAILKILANRPSQPVLQEALQKILLLVTEGQSLSEACKQFPEIFDRVFIASVNIGENSGDLSSSLKAYQQQLKTRIRFTQKIKQALAYPAFLGITMVAMLGILFLFVLPRFVSIYDSFGSELPLPTQWLIMIVEYSYIILPILLLVLFLSHRIFKSLMAGPNTGFWLDKAKLGLPYSGELLKTAYSGQVAGLLSTLTNAGIPLVKAVAITADSMGNRFINRTLRTINQQIESGNSLSASLTSAGLFPDTSLQIIQAAEASGNLSDMLNEVASYHEQRVDYSLSKIMGFIEPLIMLLMGVIVGGIIFVMYLPIFNVAEIIQ